ncbi:MAG TPA: GreA/GreB family elongation factor [Salinimicrobium sp.]|nr:GreA/GreB family elongation factor [Salinimicrobium sp.]
MSRGFVKEDDQEEAPFIPPRAALPTGAINYVTPRGYQLLLKEKANLETERSGLKAENETERRRALAVIDGKLQLLKERLASAREIDPTNQIPDEVRFGAWVSIKNIDTNEQQEFQIVGVDEADVKKSKIAFVAPIAKAITGKKVGETANFKLGVEVRMLKILKISYK